MLEKQNLFSTLLVILLIFGGTSCSAPTNSPSDEAETAKISELEPGPIRHEQLTAEQLTRIQKIHETFREVNDASLEETIENFKRDVNPETEIVVWEQIAEAYTKYTSSHKLALEEKKAVYEILLLRSLAPEEMVLENLKTDIFSEEQAKEMMSYYEGEPEPITVDKN
jgi:hypothetical protein